MNLKKIINLTLIIFFIAFSVLFCFNKFNQTPLISGNNKNLKIYELWHIESFEGGGANRQNYLNQICLKYEKENPSTLFMVKRIKAEQLGDMLKENIPHLISFGEQVAKTLLPYLNYFDNEYNIQDNFLESAKYNRNLLALPYIASGYCYFTKINNVKNFELYTANDNLHSASHLITENINNNQTLSSYDCYVKFVNNSNIKLLGTARDLFRIKNLESNGRFDINYQPLSTFTDLIQYMGKTTNDKEISRFIDFLMNYENQQGLSKLSLFSTTQLKLYSEPTYMQMEQALKTCFVPNIFT